MRNAGWVEAQHNGVPSTQLSPTGELPPNFRFDKLETYYRLTSAGWSAIHRSDLIAACALLISVMSFALAIFATVHRP
jgi:hypothetical protein